MMVIVHLSGGFGNQLFSYAFGFAVAKERNDILAIDTAIQDTKWFFRNPDILKMNIKFDNRITYKIGKSIWERALFNRCCYRKEIGFFTKEIKEVNIKEIKVWTPQFLETIRKDKNIYLRGNWANEKYFNSVSDEIKKMFVFKENLSNQAENLYQEIAGETNSVTIHYRRGDYVKIGACPSPDYFIKGMEYMDNIVRNPIFYCFSEDIEWVREQFKNLPYDIRYPLYESADKGIEDFRLLGAGNHQIISNSTYSWWAAYLNQNVKTVIIPYDNGLWNWEFGKENWIKIPFVTIKE